MLSAASSNSSEVQDGVAVAAVGDLVARFERLVAGDPHAKKQEAGSSVRARRRPQSCSAIVNRVATEKAAHGPPEALMMCCVGQAPGHGMLARDHLLAPIFARWWRVCQWAASKRRLSTQAPSASEAVPVRNGCRWSESSLHRSANPGDKPFRFSMNAWCSERSKMRHGAGAGDDALDWELSSTRSSCSTISCSPDEPTKSNNFNTCMTQCLAADTGADAGMAWNGSDCPLNCNDDDPDCHEQCCTCCLQDKKATFRNVEDALRQLADKQSEVTGRMVPAETFEAFHEQDKTTRTSIFDIGDDDSDNEAEFFPIHLLQRGVLRHASTQDEEDPDCHSPSIEHDITQRLEQAQAKLQEMHAEYDELAIVEINRRAALLDTAAELDAVKCALADAESEKDQLLSSSAEQETLKQSLSQQLQQLKEHLQTVTSERDALAKAQLKHPSASSEALEAAKRELQDARQEIARLQSCNATEEAHMHDLEQQLEEERGRCERLNMQLQDLSCKCNELASTTKQQATIISAATEEVDAVKCALADAESAKDQLLNSSAEQETLKQSLSQQLQQLKEHLQTVTSERDALAKAQLKHQSTSSEALEAAKRELQDARQENARLQSCHATEEAHMHDLEQQLEEERGRCERLNMQLQDLSCKCNELASTTKQQATIISAATEEVDAVKCALADAESAKDQLLNSSAEQETLKQSLSQQLQQLKEHLQTVTSERDALAKVQLKHSSASSEALEAAKRELQDARQENARLQSCHATEEAHMHDLEQQLEEERSRCESLDARLQDMIQRHDILEARCSAAAEDMDVANRIVADVVTEQESMQTTLLRQALEEALQQCSSLKHSLASSQRELEYLRRKEATDKAAVQEMWQQLKEQGETCKRLKLEIQALLAARDAERQELRQARKWLEEAHESERLRQGKVMQRQKEVQHNELTLRQQLETTRKGKAVADAQLRAQASELADLAAALEQALEQKEALKERAERAERRQHYRQPRGASQPRSPSACQTAELTQRRLLAKLAACERTYLGQEAKSSDDAEILGYLRELLEECSQLLKLCRNIAAESGLQATEIRSYEAQIRARLTLQHS
eukprot:TRINITY_DN2570_c0_g1_i1.p1 TRINITY_DN2570_c0_g1~~TRINITY_DN2570_c0_g1_i1.p1  ORF type:complete len:1091 (+),score=325.77 TRINITY_DN2570_c0_g1_i1:84-3356(+)